MWVRRPKGKWLKNFWRLSLKEGIKERMEELAERFVDLVMSQRGGLTSSLLPALVVVTVRVEERGSVRLREKMRAVAFAFG